MPRSIAITASGWAQIVETERRLGSRALSVRRKFAPGRREIVTPVYPYGRRITCHRGPVQAPGHRGPSGGQHSRPSADKGSAQQ
jgi:hypothetical protein